MALLEQGNLKEAEREARLVLDDPVLRAPAWAMLGTIRLREGKYSESVSDLQKAIQINPHLVGARINLGQAYELRGDNARARQAWEAALRLDPGNYNARFDLSQLLASQHDYRRSLEAAQPVIAQLERSPEGLWVLASDYLGLKQTDRLRKVVGAWLGLPGAPVDASLRFAALLMSRGMMQEAAQVLEKSKPGGSASYAVAAELGECYLSLGDLKRAEENYHLALALNPDSTPANLGLARIAEKQKDTEKALAYLIRAKKAEPRNPDVLFEFGKVCLERDLMDDALPALEQAVALEPHRDSFVYVLASAHVAKKQYAPAAALLAQLLAKHPDDPVLNYAMGALRYLQQNYSEAESYLQKSIREEPHQLAAHYYLALVDERLGNDRQAVARFRKLLERYPEHAPSYVGLGTVLLKEKKYGEAEQALERAIQLDPQSVKAHYQLGMLLGRIGKLAESNEQMAIAQKLETAERSKNEMELRLLMPD